MDKITKLFQKYGFVLLLILPVVLVLTVLNVLDARGPYWLGTNSDPDYVYLLNASNMADMKKVGHIDHPGTPVQMIGAAAIRVTHAISGSKDDMHTDVAKRPEFYLSVINKVILGLNGFILLILGLVTLKMTQNISLALLLQSTPFLPGTVLTVNLARVTPEPLLIFTALLLTAFLVYYLHRSEEDERNTSGFLQALWMGGIIGLGIASKITFAPLAIIPLFVVRKMKAKAFYLFSLILGFVVFTLPIIGSYSKFLKWITRLATHEGRYGTGKQEIVNWDTLVNNIKRLLEGNPLFTVILGLTGGVLVIAIIYTIINSIKNRIKKKREKETPGQMYTPVEERTELGYMWYRLVLITIGVWIAQIGGLVMVARHTGEHYLVPVLSLTGFSIYLIYQLIHEMLRRFKAKPVYFPILFFILFGGWLGVNDPVAQTRKVIETFNVVKMKSLSLNDQVQEQYRGYARIYYYGSSSPQYALKFGNDLALDSHADVLSKLYHDVFFYDFINNDFFTYSYNERMPIWKLQAKYGDKIVFQGPEIFDIRGVRLKQVARNPYENVSLLAEGESSVLSKVSEWVSAHTDRGRVIVIPVEAAIGLKGIQDTYELCPVNFKTLDKRGILELNVFLKNPLFLVPTPEFYGTTDISEKDKAQLESIGNFIDMETTVSNTNGTVFLVGGLRKSGFDSTSVKAQELSLWTPDGNNHETIAPAMDFLDYKGKFDLRFMAENNRGCVVASNLEQSPGNDAFSIFGYMANSKGFNLDITKVDRVYFVARLNTPENLMTEANHLFIQDLKEDWEREKVFFPTSGWITYFVTKKIRPNSLKLLFGARFTPKSLKEDLMKMKDIKVYISYK